ncbi:MAG: DUF4910 domain-containing protein [Oscillospiraceae bacterium]|nr:DUF4910 domain-containing protein [Oscillospiraceae bacterium]
MDPKEIDRIFHDTAYIRTGGSEEELKCARYIMERCEQMGLKAHLEDFPVPMSTIGKARLLVDGEEIPCKGYLCCGSGEVEAPLYYMPNDDAASLDGCRGKIVLVDGYMRHWLYQDIREHGAAAFISYDGNANYADDDIDQRELRAGVHQGNRMLGVAINAKQAIRLVRDDAKTARIEIRQEEVVGASRNVILDLPGETEDTIVFTAHYDSTSLSQGAYDNMSGSIGLLALAERFSKAPHRCSLRFVWCGSEERGLLGSKAYVEAHREELDKVVLNINLDMIGCIMGKFIACCTAEEKLVHYIQYLGSMTGFGVKPYQDVYSSDSTPFADAGIPAVSFARAAPGNTATIHNRYDTMAVMKAGQMVKDIDFIFLFAQQMANAAHCPVAREMPEKMKEELDYYLVRKRKK